MATLPHGIRRAFRLALGRPAIEDEVDAEIAFHLEMRAAELAARGMTPDAARAEALRRFGDPNRWSTAMSEIDREHAARRRRAEWLDDLRQDLRFGVRSALRAPLFSLLAVVTLALGIGANAAVFGVVKSVLLDALPYAEPERLVRAYGRWFDGSNDRAPLSSGTILAIAERQRSFERLAAFEGRARDAIFAGDDGPHVVRVAFFEPALFRTLGVSTALGRPLRDDDAAADTAFNVVLTHATWQQRFGGDPAIIGKPMDVNGIRRTVVGVLPRGFVGPLADVEVYMPFSLRSAALGDPVTVRRRQWLGLVGRLAPGVTLEAARRELGAIASDLAREHPAEYGSTSVSALPVRDDMVGDTRTPLLVLMASAALVLVITCANLAGALLSRTISRRREFAVRVAMGAGRGRLVRQLLTESTVLALTGGAAGLLLAAAGLALLRGLALPALPAYADLSLDRSAVLVTAALALATGLAFGLAPALFVGRSDPQATLRDETRGASESRRSRRLRGVLVSGQIALCVSLLAGAGLLARSLWALTVTPLGFTPHGVLTVSVQLPRAGYATGEARARFLALFEERLRAIPGVTAAASTGELPTQSTNRNGFFIPGAPPPPNDARPLAIYATVSGDYFRAMGIPLRDGRPFGPGDRADAPNVVIISAAMARRHWPSGNAVGSRLRLDPDPTTPEYTVVGVAGDVRNDPTRPDAEFVMYVPNQQAPWNGPIFVLRTAGDPLALVRAVQRELAAVDPGIPLRSATTLDALLSDGLSGRRLPVLLMTAFGALALLLASVGVYAMFASMAAAREREFGVRIALGSSRGAIAALVLRQGGVWMALGLVAGAGGVAVVARAVRGLLYGVQPFDPVALGVAVLTLVVCGALALLAPVRRATRADPISALR
jgi:putative ABC transport system permease protein